MTACSRAPIETPPLRILYPNDMVTLDPHAHNAAATEVVLSAIYESLVRCEPGMPVTAMLADRWTTPDDTTWQFHIREGVPFHDGSLLTPADVVWSIERARTKGALGSVLADLEEVHELDNDDRVVEIITSRPSPLLLSRLRRVAIVPANFDPDRPTGTGPYVWRVGSLQGPVLLRRWDAYWGQPAVAEDVSIQFEASEDKVSAMIRDGRVDVVALLRPDYLSAYGPVEGWKLFKMPSVGTTILCLNAGEPPLDDPRVRAAIDMAIDRRRLVAAAFPEGTAQPAGSLVPAEVFGYGPEQRPLVANAATARKLLSEAGLKGRMPLRFMHSSLDPAVVDLLVDQLAGIGLDLETSSLPYEVFYRMIENGGAQLMAFTWNFSESDASSFLDLVVHSRDPERGLGRINVAGFSDSAVDDLIEAATREPRTAVRLRLLQEALNGVRQANVYLPLYHPSRLALVRAPFVVGHAGGPMVRPQEVQLQP